MSFIVTARKWRPNLFSEVAGQEHITSTLKNAIKSGRIAHAYIFTGPRGVGKTTTARILAKTLNCLNPVDNEPCNSCELCLSIQNNQSMDIIEIDAASNRGIDDIRTLRESVKYAPTRGKYKVYIIDEVHMLTKESFNAFLKTLEEPPSHTIFIFATTDIHKVPLTIISRCQRFDFRRIQIKTIKEQLAKIAAADGIEIDDLTLTTIARKADGALRDAESFFDQIVSFCGNKIDSETVAQMLNQIDDEIYFTISDAILDKNFKAVFDVSDEMYAHGYDFIELLNGLSDHFRNILTVVITGKTAFLETAEAFKNKYLDYYGKFTQGDLLRILNFLNKTSQEMRYSQNHRLKIEISLSHLIGLEKSLTISEVLSNLDNLDQVLQEPEKKNDNRDEVKKNPGNSKSNQDRKVTSLPPEKNSKVSYPSGIEESSTLESTYVADPNPWDVNIKTPGIQKENSSTSDKLTDHSISESDNLTNGGSTKEGTQLPVSPSPASASKFNAERKSVAHELKSNGEISFEVIQQKWDHFVSIVAAEKKLTLGTYIRHSVLAGFEGNKIKLQLDDEHGRKSFQYDNDYLLKKSLEIFGKKLNFVFIDNLTKKEHSPVRKLSEKKEEDPIINLILTELGGEEIT